MVGRMIVVSRHRTTIGGDIVAVTSALVGNSTPCDTAGCRIDTDTASGGTFTMRRISLFAATIATLFLAQTAIAQGQDFSKVKIKIDDLGHGLYMLTGAGGNIGVSAGEDGVFIIDDQFAPLSAKIKAAIGTISDKPIRFVINTHWHGDHTGGNENFGKDGAIIVAQDNVYARMSVDQVMPAFNRTVPAAPRVALPVITYRENMTLHQNGHTVAIHHVHNAHTDGDSLIRFTDANVVHMGDTYFAGRFPFIDSA